MINEILIGGGLLGISGLFWLAYSHPASFARLETFLNGIATASALLAIAFVIGWTWGAADVAERARSEHGIYVQATSYAMIAFWAPAAAVLFGFFLQVLRNLHSLLDLPRRD